METTLVKFSQGLNEASTGICVVVVMSHGEKEGICSKDGNQKSKEEWMLARRGGKKSKLPTKREQKRLRRAEKVKSNKIEAEKSKIQTQDDVQDQVQAQVQAQTQVQARTELVATVLLFLKIN